MDLNSLHNRYTLLSLLLGLLVLLASIAANLLLTDTKHQAAQNIDNRQVLQLRSRVIRDNIWQAREALGHFLIDPERHENQETILRTIGESISSTERLLSERTKLTVTQYEQATHIRNLLLNLDSAANELIKIRLDLGRQYPSLVLARTELLPRQQEVLDSFTIAIQEISEDLADDKKSDKTYRLLIEARHRWALLISNVRMLITSRIGSFGLESLASQQQDIEIFYNDFRNKIKQIKNMLRHYDSGLLTESAIDEIDNISHDWHRYFTELLAIHTSDKWRGDIQHLRSQIDPILEEVWHELLAFDVALEGSAEKDVTRLSGLAQKQSYAIWLIGLFGLGFVVLGYINLRRSILAPISMLANAFSQETHGQGNTLLPTVNSTEFRTLVSAFTDMRRQVRNRQDALEHQALHDSLTDLGNRTLLYERLTNAISQSKRYRDNITLILMDLDRFKEVNDALGHQVGDQLLVAAAIRLRHLLRDSDTIARLGGDEFAILLTHCDEEEARSVSRKILKAFERSFEVNEHELYVGASLGVAVFPQHGHDTETLIKCADVAMYVAKRNRLGFTFYEASNDNYDDRYLSLANDIRQALKNEEFSVCYQLQYQMKTGEAIGVEALLRWKHKELGYISPDNIIPLAEQQGLINRLTLWVMEQAIKQYAQWRTDGVYVSIAVNMSVYDLQYSEIVDHISALLSAYDVPASCLVVEISESAMLIDPIHAIDILNRLDAMGVRIAIDDFGTGFSSLGYLKQLPVDELKIDKSFVIDMIDNENDAVIVRSTIDLAHNLGLRVIAEGVETSEIYDLLSILNCDVAQGFYMCEPVTAEQILTLLQKNKFRTEKISV